MSEEILQVCCVCSVLRKACEEAECAGGEERASKAVLMRSVKCMAGAGGDTV